MPTAVACPKCQQKYNLPESLMGKVVQCKKCKAKFQVGKPVASKPVAAGAGTAPANQAQRQNAAALQQMGLDQLQASPDLFGSAPPPTQDPLANHVVHDPGFGEARTYVEAPEEERHAYADLFENPELGQKKKRRKSGDLSKYGVVDEVEAVSPLKQPWMWVLILLGVMAFATIVIHFATYEWGRPMGRVNLIVVCAVSFAVNLWFLFSFFSSKPTQFEIIGFFLIPFYVFVIMAKKFNELKSCVIASIICWVFTIVAVVLLFVTMNGRY